MLRCDSDQLENYGGPGHTEEPLGRNSGAPGRSSLEEETDWSADTGRSGHWPTRTEKVEERLQFLVHSDLPFSVLI